MAIRDLYIIGLTGLARSGKNTVGAEIAQYGYRPVAFATPIKHMLDSLFEYIDLSQRDHIWNDEWKEAPVLGKWSPRGLAQTLGTEWGRKTINSDLWLDLLQAHIQSEYRRYGYNKFVITDVRFNNEAEWLREVGKLVHVIRKEHNTYVRPHESEAGIARQPADYVINNDSDLFELRKRVRFFMEARER